LKSSKAIYVTAWRRCRLDLWQDGDESKDMVEVPRLELLAEYWTGVEQRDERQSR